MPLIEQRGKTLFSLTLTLAGGNCLTLYNQCRSRSANTAMQSDYDLLCYSAILFLVCSPIAGQWYHPNCEMDNSILVTIFSRERVKQARIWT